MKNKHIFAAVLVLVSLVSCGGNVGDGGIDGNKLSGGEVGDKKAQEKKEAKKPPVQVKQPIGRNAPCENDADCEEGYKCIESSGTCQEPCEKNADCGNGLHCRSGECKSDCSGLGEKCSERRPCCFFDEDGDKQDDAHCIPDDEGDKRCLL